MATYTILRKFFNHETETIETGLSLEEAQEHCKDPETSSRTCTSAEGLLRNELGQWFDCYVEE